jgi:cytoskeletal protein CcmA (bactofilin family)
MADLTNSKPKDTYQRLVQVESDETNRFKRFQNGLGSPILSASFYSLEVANDIYVRSGSVYAQSFITTYTTSSTLFQSGSTQFGDDLTDNHAFTGSVEITGSLKLAGTDFTLTGSLNHLGQYNHTGNTVQIGDVNLIGNKIHTGNLTITGLSSLVGDLEQTGNFNLTGSISALGNISANPGVFMNPKVFKNQVTVPPNNNAGVFGPLSNNSLIRIQKNSKLRIFP